MRYTTDSWISERASTDLRKRECTCINVVDGKRGRLRFVRKDVPKETGCTSDAINV